MATVSRPVVAMAAIAAAARAVACTAATMGARTKSMGDVVAEVARWATERSLATDDRC